MEVLGEGECWQLLERTVWGRLAVIVGDHPEVFPVNIACYRKTIVFRLDPGTKLSAALGDADVAFEVDDADVATRQGWSVLAVGPAVRVGEPRVLAELEDLGLLPWVAGPKADWLRLTPRRVSGRRLRPDLLAD